MKKFFRLLVILTAVCSGFLASATTRTVNNATIPVPPGQYSTIGAAIAAASVGDTILVAGSPTPYDASTVIIDKQLVLIGAGYNPLGANRNASTIAQSVQLNSTASGSSLIGFIFSKPVSTSPVFSSRINNITFARNYFLMNLTFSNPGLDTCFNIQLINNIFVGSVIVQIAAYFSNSAFYNNVFLNNSELNLTNVALSPVVVIDHNLFLSGSHTFPLISPTFTAINEANALITNNIFYNANPTFCLPSINDILNNNLTYAGSTVLNFPQCVGTLSASGNLNNTNPMLNSVFNTSDPFNFSLDNIGLKIGSPAINAGSDGTNIGPTGGLFPIYNTNSSFLTGEPGLPEVTQLNVVGSSTIQSGAPLLINIAAKKMN